MESSSNIITPEHSQQFTEFNDELKFKLAVEKMKIESQERMQIQLAKNRS